MELEPNARAHGRGPGHARAWPAELALRRARDRACTLVLASEIDFASILKDAEGPNYLSLRCVSFVSWAYPPL